MQERLPFSAIRHSKGNGGHMSANQPWRLTMLMLLSLLLISCGVRNARCSTVPADSSTDMLWLLDFKAVTNDSTQALSSWNRCTPHCLWKGVNCSLAHPGRVTALNLTGQNLQGKIAPSLGNLTFLTTLLLSSNGFFGQLPTLNRLHRLQYLDLGGNKLQGFNPDALRNCSNLTSLDLSFNLITGSLPPNIGSLSSLVYLNLVENSFSGIIPPSIQNITNLQFLALSDNQIQGNIPVELGQLPDITRLLLGGNSLSGRIPTTLLNNSALLVLDLNSNFLQMKLPSNIGDTLPNLLALNLQGNMLEGRIPASLGNASFLCIIYLSYNNLTGQIPASFGNLRAMTDLKLDNNKFEAKDNQGWKFLDALSNCGSLQVLALNDNQLNGAIPNSVGNLSTSLKKLGFHHNYLSGTVPEGIRNLTGLTMLLLDHNNLTGPIGAWVGNLKNLSVVTLSDNNFTGLIPSSIGSLTQLTKLFLSRNNFEGPIPPSLGNLPLLLQLHLSNNSLKGHIPTELFSPLSAMTNCVISYNNLDGPIPPEISNLKHLIELDLSSNKLSGQVPATLGECQGLEILLVDNNFLSGNIPMSMSGLKSLSMLNLSHNNFSGYITIELSNLPYLTQLDLSYNNLQGEIPRDGVFRNATAISVEGNWGLCGGVIDLHMPMCHTVSRKSSLGLSVGIGMGSGAGLLLMVLGALFLTRRLKRRRAKMLKQKFFKQNRGYLLQQLVSQNTDIAERMIIPLVELEKATNNFDKAREIGGGGHGTVYKGIMSDLHVVAIKKSKVAIQREIDEFINEVAILSQINHRNVVKLFGCCLETEVPLLVYEFISNGTLYHHLHVDEPESSLPWVDRLRIATETARALAYLHSAVSFPIVHRDIKSQNILIDGNLIAKVSDFGASRCIPINQTGNATAIQGTFGYLDPMYYYSGRLTEKSDVYSFGVLLMELLTKKKPCSFRSEDEESLVAYFTALLATSDLVRVLDPQVVVEGAKEVEEVAMLAGACVRMDGDHRPTMRQVEMTLESLRVPHENVNVYEMDAPTYAVVGGKSAEEVSRQYSLEEEYLLSSRYPR